MSQKTLHFAQRLGILKDEIDAELALHVKALHDDAVKNYTPYSVEVIDAYLSVLNRGGKRIRGALTVIGYEMRGGTDHATIIKAAAAIEMVHAYILVLDDVMDRSNMRRGGLSSHAALTQYHKLKGLSGESEHFGEATSINGALIGGHYAQSLVSSLNAPAQNKLKALQLLNDALAVTGHGQINDIFNEAIDVVTEQDVDRVLEWKTAHYTFLNPLQFGMALAGSTAEELNSIYDYCMYAGRAFQITDDILGTFSSELEAGKSPMDDIREGKRTMLTVAALTNAPQSDQNFLIQMLGNEHITTAQFNRCKEIIVESGALDYARTLAKKHIQKAVNSLTLSDGCITNTGNEFLTSLVQSLIDRNN